MNKIKISFNEIAGNYDSQRKSLIPCFDEFYKVVIDLAEIKHNVENILDLGAGTGLLSDFLLKKYPDVNFTLIDVSEEMLNISRTRFQKIDKINYINADYINYDFGKQYDIIVSALSIHHLDNCDKKKLYFNVYNLLKTGGIFVNGDQFIARSENLEGIYRKNWISKIEKSSLNENEKHAAFERMKLDKPATIEDNLKWLDEAGFYDSDLFYKYYNFGIIKGIK